MVRPIKVHNKHLNGKSKFHWFLILRTPPPNSNYLYHIYTINNVHEPLTNANWIELLQKQKHEPLTNANWITTKTKRLTPTKPSANSPTRREDSWINVHWSSDHFLINVPGLSRSLKYFRIQGHLATLILTQIQAWSLNPHL